MSNYSFQVDDFRSVQNDFSLTFSSRYPANEFGLFGVSFFDFSPEILAFWLKQTCLACCSDCADPYNILSHLLLFDLVINRQDCRQTVHPPGCFDEQTFSLHYPGAVSRSTQVHVNANVVNAVDWLN